MKTRKLEFAQGKTPISPRKSNEGPDHHKMLQVRTKVPLKEQGKSCQAWTTPSSHEESGNKMNQVSLDKNEDRNSL